MFSIARRNWTKAETFGAIFLFLCNFANAQSASGEQRTTDSEVGFKISGTVVNALTGAPLSQARIALTDTADQANTLSVLTTEDGRFAFTALKRGKFVLFGAKRGFVRELYQQHQEFSTAIVTGPGLDTENLVMRLMPLAFLSGKVFDETGEAVRQANVTLYAETHRTGANRIEPFNSEVTETGLLRIFGSTSGKLFCVGNRKTLVCRPRHFLTSTRSKFSAGRPNVSRCGLPHYVQRWRDG